MSLVELRRMELRHNRRDAALAVATASVMVVAAVAVLIEATTKGLSAALVLGVLGVQWMLPNLATIRNSTRELAELAPRTLPAARIVIRNDKRGRLPTASLTS